MEVQEASELLRFCFSDVWVQGDDPAPPARDGSVAAELQQGSIDGSQPLPRGVLLLTTASKAVKSRQVFDTPAASLKLFCRTWSTN